MSAKVAGCACNGRNSTHAFNAASNGAGKTQPRRPSFIVDQVPVRLKFAVENNPQKERCQGRHHVSSTLYLKAPKGVAFCVGSEEIRACRANMHHIRSLGIDASTAPCTHVNNIPLVSSFQLRAVFGHQGLLGIPVHQGVCQHRDRGCHGRIE